MDTISQAIENNEFRSGVLEELINGREFTLTREHLMHAVGWEDPSAVELIIQEGVVPDNDVLDHCMLSVGTDSCDLLERMLIILLRGGASEDHLFSCHHPRLSEKVLNLISN